MLVYEACGDMESGEADQAMLQALDAIWEIVAGGEAEDEGVKEDQRVVLEQISS